MPTSPKPIFSVRKPPTPATIESFVAAGDAAPYVPANEPSETLLKEIALPPRKRARGLVKRANGQVRRRLTVYVSPELAKRAFDACAASDRDVSELAAEALERFLT